VTPFGINSLRIALRQQNEHRNARGGHRQKPLPDSRNQMDGIHVCTPLTELSNSYEVAPAADAQQTE
jgi:hypothetical protein